MHELEAERRLVKSAPELWAQCSDPGSLSRHLRGFGEIRITRLDPESTVAWEGESARGTVSLEASGWGTRVRLTATPPTPAARASAPAAAPRPDPEVLTARVSLPTRGLPGLLAALWRRGRGPARTEDTAPAGTGTPLAAAVRLPGAPAGTASPVSPAEIIAGLEAALDSLGQAHHRPYSRS